MKKLALVFALLFSSSWALGQACVPSNTQSCTPNVQLALPFVNSPNWNVPLNQNMTLLDQLLSGNANLTALRFSNGTISGNVTFSGSVAFSGGLTVTGQNSISVFNLNGVINVDGQRYSGPQALQSAIQACAGLSFCVVYALNPAIGTQTFLVNPWAGLTMPVTLYTGAYTVRYDTSGIRVGFPSHFKWYAFGSVVTSTAPFVASNTIGNGGILDNLNYGTTGSITSGSNSLTVANATGAEAGVIVTILGANGIETKQATTINQGGGIGVADTSFTVTSTSGWSTSSTNYLKIDSEIISVTGGTGTTFTGASRGLFGTTAATHANGATVSAVPDLVSRITSVSGNTLTLEDNATTTVSNATVVIGSTDIILEGMTVDGKTDGVTGRGLSGIVISQGTKVVIAPSVKVQNMDLYGTALLLSRYNSVGGSFDNVGKVPVVGADVFLFGSSSYNSVRTYSHNNGTKAIAIDDRSTVYDPSNGPSNANSVILGPVTNYGPTSGQPAIDIEGSNYNDVYVPYLKVLNNGYGTGIISAQWVTNPTTLVGNTIRFGYIDASAGSGTALYSTNYTSTVPQNSFLGGTISGAVNLVPGDATQYVNGKPAIASGFGTSPSIVNSNGTAVFTLNVGTGGTATSGVLTMPAASVGWSCQVSDLNTNIVTRETAYTTTSVTLTAASAWTASDKLLINCGAF